MSAEWIVLKELPEFVMVAVSGTDRSEKYIREGSSHAEKNLEKAQGVLYDALEFMSPFTVRQCSKADYEKFAEACYYLGVELYDETDDS